MDSRHKKDNYMYIMDKNGVGINKHRKSLCKTKNRNQEIIVEMNTRSYAASKT